MTEKIEKALPSLKAMAEAKVEGISKLTNFIVDPDILEIVPGFNLRIPGPDLDEHMERMYQAMKAGASMPPIDVIVRDGRVLVRRGHCRTINAKRLKAEGIPYSLQARHYRGNEVEEIFDMLGENMGKPFSPLESGIGYMRLVKFNMKPQEIADRQGVSLTTVENGLILAEAPVEVQEMISSGKVAAHAAIATIRQHGSKAAEVLRALIEKANASGKARVTKQHVSGPRIPPKVARSLVEVTGSIRSAIGEKNVAEILEGDSEAMKDRMVSVPASALRALLEAHAKVAETEQAGGAE